MIANLKRISAFLGFLCVFLWLPEAVSQDPVYWQLTDEDGLPSMTVYDINQDSFGFVWLGTSNGLVRYDGKEFKPFIHPEQKDNEIVTVRKDAEGRIWFSNLSNQVFFIDNGVIHNFSETLEQNQFKITSYDVGISGYVFNCQNDTVPDTSFIYYLPEKYSGNLFEFFQDKLIAVSTEERNPALEIDSNKFVYNFFHIASQIKFADFSHSSQKGKDFLAAMQILQSHISPYSFYTFGNNRLYSCVQTYHSVDINTLSHESFVFPYKVNNIVFVGDDCWLATQAGLVVDHMYPGGVENGDFDYFFEGLDINNIFKDREGNIWLATDGNGIWVIPSFSFLQPAGIDKDEPAYFITKTKNGTIFTGHKKGKISLFNGLNGASLKNIEIPVRSGRILNMLAGNYFLLATDNGIYYSKDSLFSIGNFLKNSGAAKDMLIDSNDSLWIANSRFTTMLPLSDLETSVDFSSVKTIISSRTNCLHEDNMGRIWMGTSSGIFIYRDGKTYPFQYKEQPFTYNIQEIIETKDSSIWIGTQYNGIFQLKNDTIVKIYNKDNHLNSNTCNDLHEDSYGNLWIASNSGLQVKKMGTDQFQTYNIYDGLPSNEVFSVITDEQTVWAGTSKGIVSFPLNQESLNLVVPLINITRFSIMGQDTSIVGEYELSYNQNTLRIDYQGLGYRAQGNIRYEYQMLGISDIWIPTSSENITFPGLSPGNYTFSVKAVNEDDTPSLTPATLRILINPPWWKTWWFRVFITASLLLLIWSAYRYRLMIIRRQENLKREFQQKVNELSMQALQTQMNPHFIFNSLNAIQHFLTTNDQENAMFYLSKFAHLIRTVFEQSGKKMISLEEELEFLKLYLKLEDLRFNNKVKINLIVDEEIKQTPEDYYLPPLLIQPVIENAFKHGLFHKKGEKDLTIEIKKHSNFIKCIVTDNGIGIKKAQSYLKWKSKEHKSAGLYTIRERLAIHHKYHPTLKEEESYFKVTDIMNDSQPAGTQVTLVI
ncbi:MAG: hypothetical protein DWQ02_17615 [Bacteroidetes bacterium]|nr:MAG: hypothetical protein DWQ02_17615 [Bacteroidota bacterium]